MKFTLERCVQTFKNKMRKNVEAIHERLTRFLSLYRTTVQETTCKTPVVLFLSSVKINFRVSTQLLFLSLFLGKSIFITILFRCFPRCKTFCDNACYAGYGAIVMFLHCVCACVCVCVYMCACVSECLCRSYSN